jgi:SAM-dependent methyltransferase
LHLAGHANSVVATDVNPRALALAAATARLNGQHWDLREGSLYDPIADEEFDLIVSNPPFVISDGAMRYSYRDSGLAGDGICRALVENIATHLRPGGTGQLLANWIVREDSDWRDRVGGWVSATECDAWVVQREMADPAEYVGLWLADAGEDGKAGSDRSQALLLAQNWLDYLAAERVKGIGMGLITVRRSGSAEPSVTMDEITGQGEEVTGDEADGFLRRRAWAEHTPDGALLDCRLALSPQVMLEQRSLAGHDGWRTVLRMVRRQGGPGAVLQLDEWGQALLAGCTGAVPLQVLIDLLAAAHGLPTEALAAAVLPSVRVAVIRGLLEPVGS